MLKGGGFTLAERKKVQKMSKTGAIIVGYQGIGKSTLAKNGNGYIDLESGNFWIEGKRAEDWYIPYCNIALNLAEQGYKVFVSSHQVVRDYLATVPKHTPVDLYCCFPSYTLKNEWIDKLHKRYQETNLDKDYKAWQNALDRYDENIKELHQSQGFIPIIITNMHYYLSDVLNCDMKKG